MFLIAAASSLLLAQQVMPVLWLDLRGNVLVNGQPASPRVNPGVTRFNTPEGVTYNFGGHKSGILFGDDPALKLSGSMTIAAWLYPRQYVVDGPGAQILFRGDDRCGLDPYTFVIEPDGTVNFAIQNERDQGMKVKAEIPLDRWTHVTASFNAQTGEMALWLNGDKTAYAHTSKLPFTNLDPGQAPGVGVGNVQNDHGPHNQPYTGMLADLRLYDRVLTPEEAGFSGPRGIQP